MPSPWDVGLIQKQAKDVFDEWGGEPTLRELFPALPPMSGPRPAVIRRPHRTLDRFDSTEEPKPAFKGGDVPKSELEGNDGS